MIPNITRGGDTVRLLRYLTGKGRRDEHTSPHLVAGQAAGVMLEYSGRQLRPGDAVGVAALIDEPMHDFETVITIAEKDADGKPTGTRRAAHVWHCSLSLAPEEPDLADETWQQIAERYVAAMGLDPQDGTPACRWVAVRHGRSNGDSDHIHIVVNLAREDGTKAVVHMDRPRAQRACRELEQQFGLRQVEGRGRGAGERGVKPGEVNAARHGGSATERIPDDHAPRRQLERIVRACATAAVDEPDFVARLRDEGLLVRARLEKDDPASVSGYSVALRPAGQERPVWYGGGRLSRELTLPRLRAAWPPSETSQAGVWKRPVRPVAPGHRTRTPASDQGLAAAARQLADLRERLSTVSQEDQSTWAIVARDTAGLLSALSLRTEAQPGPIASAARVIARSAQLRAQAVPGRPHRALPPTQTTTAAILRSAGAPVSSRRIITQAISLATAIGEMHAAAGEASRAAELERDAITRLASITPSSQRQPGSALEENRHRISPHPDHPDRGSER